jgi:hypothetical protein
MIALELAMIAREHWGRLSPHDRQELSRIVRKSAGRPGNLTAHEKRELSRIVKALEPLEAGRRLLPLGGKLRRGRRH